MFLRVSTYNPKFYNWIFFSLLILVSFAYSYSKIINLPPQSIHQWRQSDCLSITMNYFQEDRGFLEPSVHWTGTKGNGNTVSEFPIIYFTVSKLWKVFGYHHYIFRLLDTLILFLALFALYKFCESLLQNSIWAILITFFFFTSPILVYYGNNFTADVPALSLAIIGWFFFWKFYTTEKNVWLIISVLFFFLAILLKASAGVSFACIGLLFLLELFNLLKIKDNKKLFTKPGLQLLIFSLPIILIFSWYSFASHYNKENNYGLFLLGILPIWDLDRVHIVETTRALIHELLPHYFNLACSAILLSMFGLLIVFRKKVNRMFLIITCTMFFCFILFIVLFFQVFNVHDYYLINMLVLVIFILVTFFVFIKQNYPQLLRNTGLKILFSLLLCFSIYSTAVYQKAKYFGASSVFLDQKEVEYWKWFHWDYNNRFRSLESITPYLRSIGVKREDKVFSMPDQSINISLYLMDQKGWTEYGYDEYNNQDFIKYILRNGAKYLIINDPEELKEDYLQPYLKNQIGAYRNVKIFSLENLTSQN